MKQVYGELQSSQSATVHHQEPTQNSEELQ